MKRITYVSLAAVVLAGMFQGLACAQDANVPEPSLGSYARSVRKEKKPGVRQFDNDNLPQTEKISVVGGATQASAESAAAPPDGAPADGSKSTAAPNPPAPLAVQPGESQEQRQAVYDDWKQRLSDQKSQVDLLSRELDVEQREYKLRTASMYGDAGERLRNEANWDKQDKQYQQDLAAKQKILQDAKQHLDDLQDNARKSGVPSNVSESAQQPPAPDQQ